METDMIYDHVQFVHTKNFTYAGKYVLMTYLSIVYDHYIKNQGRKLIFFEQSRNGFSQKDSHVKIDGITTQCFL